MNIQKLLQQFAQKYPIFHSEADFQFKFAWFLKEQVYKDKDIILEKPFDFESGLELTKVQKKEGECEKYRISRIYVDIVIDGTIAIELKYKTKKLQYREYNLKSHGAQNDNIIRVENDLHRLKKLTEDQDCKIKKGYFIFLTNDIVYENKTFPQKSWEEFSKVDNSEFKYFINETT